MKKNFIIWLFLLGSINAISQIDSTNIQFYSDFCQIWGASKYYSPSANIENLCFDSLLVKLNKKIQNHEYSDINEIYSMLIPENPEMQPYIDYTLNDFADSLINSLDLSAYVNDNIIGRLHNLYQCQYDSLFYMNYNYPQGNSKPQNELVYDNSTYPDFNVRLISAFRYWNIIHYFYPYKKLFTEEWTYLMDDLLFTVCNAKDSVHYHLALKAFVNRIDDSHSFFYSEIFYPHFQSRQIPLLFHINDESIIIRSVLNPVSLTDSVAISRGDKVLQIDNMDFNALKRKYYKYAAGSNKFSKNIGFGGYIKWTHKDTVPIKYIHEGSIIETFILSIPDTVLYDRYITVNQYDSVFNIDTNMVYIDLGEWKYHDIPRLIRDVEDKDVLIFDLRSYPEYTMYDLLPYFPHDTTTPFFAGWEPVKNQPGRFSHFTVGTQNILNDTLLNCHIISLVNGFSQSRSEFYTMALQLCDNNITIGTTTSGADGDVSSVNLPGRIETYYSGIAIEYSDGTQTQRNGVKLDVELDITPEDWKKYSDPYLEKTILWCKENL